MRRYLVLIAIWGCFCTTSPMAAAPKLTILFSGETHSHLYPCDCPLNPAGGLSRRSTIIKNIKSENPATLVLDAGGIFAGGKYDEKVQGELLDRARTDVNLRALAMMGYDAAVLGDEEFGFGLEYLKDRLAAHNPTFVAANVYTADDKLLTLPYVIKQYDDYRIGIIGLTTPELLSGEFRDHAVGIKVTDPLEAVQKTLNGLRGQVDLVIVLSHLGEEAAREILQKTSGIDLLLNAHRKISAVPFDKINDSILAQFNFQGKALGRVDYTFTAEKKISAADFTEVNLGPEVAADPEIEALLQEYEAKKPAVAGKVVVDLYVMSDCPYGQEAEAVILPLLQEMAAPVDFHLYYLLDKKGADFVSLHGPEEVAEARRQLAVAQLYPEKLFAYILSRNEVLTGTPASDCLAKLGLDAEAVEKLAASLEITAQLTAHAERTQRLQVKSSPTLYLNNTLYQGRLEAWELRQSLCGKLSAASQEATPACAEIPRCFTDADCASPGKSGICVDPGTPRARCEELQEEPFELLVVVAADCLLCNHPDIISSSQALFPSVRARLVDKDSAEGKALVAKYELTRLPAYLFAPAVENTRKFPEVKAGFFRRGDKIILSPEAVNASYYLERERQAKRLDIYLAALSVSAQNVGREIIGYLAQNPPGVEVKFHLLGWLDEEGEATSPRGQLEAEEARRALVVRKFYPEKFLPYLSQRNPQSSYWEDTLLELGLKPEEIKTLAEGEIGRQLFREEAENIRGLAFTGELGFLLNNREVAQLKSLESFQLLLQALAGKESVNDR